MSNKKVSQRVIDQDRLLMEEARGKKPRFVSPVCSFGSAHSALYEEPRGLHGKVLRAQWELSIAEEEQVLVLWHTLESSNLFAAVALVDHVVDRGKIEIGGDESRVTIARVGDKWYGGSGIGHRCDYVACGGWITKAICANLLLESLLWLPATEKERCWDLINPKKKYPGSRVLF